MEGWLAKEEAEPPICPDTCPKEKYFEGMCLPDQHKLVIRIQQLITAEFYYYYLTTFSIVIYECVESIQLKII